MQKYRSLEHTIRNRLERVNEDENTTTPQPNPLAPQDAKPEASPQSLKKNKANDKENPWSDKDDPNTITIGEVTPVDPKPELDHPKDGNNSRANVPVGKNAVVEDEIIPVGKVFENQYNLSRKKSTLESDLAFAHYQRTIGQRVIDIVKRRQAHADEHGIRPFGHAALGMKTESIVTVHHPVELVGHVIDAAMKGLGTDARLNVHVPRVGGVHHVLGAHEKKVSLEKKPEEKEEAKSSNVGSISHEPSVNDKLVAAASKMGSSDKGSNFNNARLMAAVHKSLNKEETVQEGFMKRRYNVSDIHSEVDKFHPSVPHENVSNHIDKMTSHWGDPVQKSQASSDASMYHERRQKEFRKSQSSQKLSLSSPAHQDGAGLSENLGAPGAGIQKSSTSGNSGGIQSTDKSNIQKNKVRQGVAKKSASSFSNKNWQAPGVTEDLGDMQISWVRLKKLDEIMGYISQNRDEFDGMKVKLKPKYHLSKAIEADRAAKSTTDKWKSKHHERIRDRHLVHYINGAGMDDLKKLHKAMTSEDFEAMMTDKYSNNKNKERI